MRGAPRVLGTRSAIAGPASSPTEDYIQSTSKCTRLTEPSQHQQPPLSTSPRPPGFAATAMYLIPTSSPRSHVQRQNSFNLAQMYHILYSQLRRGKGRWDWSALARILFYVRREYAIFRVNIAHMNVSRAARQPCNPSIDNKSRRSSLTAPIIFYSNTSTLSRLQIHTAETRHH